MEDARSYMIATAPATEGLFKLLNAYGWSKMRAFVEITKSRTREELEKNKESFSSTDVAREVIAGSILQIAYVALDRFAMPTGKSESTLHFEAEINRLIQENPGARTKGLFSLPERFCVGREIGHLPMGMLVYAGRNQYNHFGAERLSALNEVVFNHLHAMWPGPRLRTALRLTCMAKRAFAPILFSRRLAGMIVRKKWATPRTKETWLVCFRFSSNKYFCQASRMCRLMLNVSTAGRGRRKERH